MPSKNVKSLIAAAMLKEQQRRAKLMNEKIKEQSPDHYRRAGKLGAEKRWKKKNEG